MRTGNCTFLFQMNPLSQIKVEISHTVDVTKTSVSFSNSKLYSLIIFLVGKVPASLRKGDNRHSFHLNMTTFMSGFQECT